MMTELRSKRLAVFDVDETLITCKSMFEFLQFALHNTLGREAGGVVFVRLMERLQDARRTEPREVVNRLFYSFLAGWRISDLNDLAQRWFQTKMVKRDGFFHKPPLSALHQHQASGDDVALLSGSARFIIAPLAAYLEVSHVMAIELELAEDGESLTGQISGFQTIGEGKAAALSHFLKQLPAPPTEIIGYGDHESDLPFLKCCGQQTVVIHDKDHPAWASELKSPQFMTTGSHAVRV